DFNVTKNIAFCSADPANPSFGICKGDRGAPFLCRENDKWIIYGVVLSEECGKNPKVAEIAIRVYSSVKWIRTYL
ncbi:hyaluronan-binding protein 2, partial [Plakobranchus ocellatus]